jgi:hypothetical protein
MNQTFFLLLNLALGFYNTGTIWAHEVDIFRSWQYMSQDDFHTVQEVHWRKLPYWVFTPAGLALVGALGLLLYHPVGSPVWAIWGNLLCQVLALGLTMIYWAPWQARLSQDPLGPHSPYLVRILKTHWVRTALITAYGAILLIWALQVLT